MPSGGAGPTLYDGLWGFLDEAWRLEARGRLDGAVLPASVAPRVQWSSCDVLRGLVAVLWFSCRLAAQAPPFMMDCGAF